ncbi:hypothetical protein FOVG_17298 [Fusarium oxysporum f. sp. pisi HDV247]|uniref:Uncharacterized protein n=1 Tax=Fusarium oxysporum f. sp. pisi HDV247 TaxID=1080344 RepID=W9NUG5_FUSOX|nr:hypothetical protein FOVG_17298 [Fusarium oxysporum f. sp. pisi HDV247]
MQSWILLLSCLLFICIPDVLARRGGGGGGHGGSDDDGGGDDSSTDDRCATHDGTVWKWDLIPDNAQNHSRGESEPGSFFKGEASLNFTITAGELCGGNSKGPIQMLGYAWIGPQPEYPVGPTNSIIIGFKAWESDMSIDEIDESYAYIQEENDNYCPRQPDLFRIITTYGWLDTDHSAKTLIPRAADFMNLSVTEGDGDQATVFFNAIMPDTLDHKPDYKGLFLMPPQGICHSGLQYKFSLPDRLEMTGSFTNTTLDLTLLGSGNTTAKTSGYETYKITAEFNVTFSGVFDGDNSTEQLNLGQPGGPLVDWEPNSGSHVAPLGWIMSLVYIVTLILFVSR